PPVLPWLPRLTLVNHRRCVTAFSSRRSSPPRRLPRLLLFDQLPLDHYLDLVADDELAVQHHVEVQPELLAVELALRAVRDPVPHHRRIVELPVLQHAQRYRSGDALDRQVTGQRVLVRPGRLHARAPERDRRILLDL